MRMHSATALGDIGKLTADQKAAIEAKRVEFLHARLVGEATKKQQRQTLKAMRKEFRQANKSGASSVVVLPSQSQLSPDLVQAMQAYEAAGQGAPVATDATAYVPPMSTGGGGSAGGGVTPESVAAAAMGTGASDAGATGVQSNGKGGLAVPAAIAAILYFLAH